MRRIINYAIALFTVLVFGSMLGACSNDDLTSENTVDGQKVLTKHVVMNVQGDSLLTSRAGGKQSRFIVTLPEGGVGKTKYTFVEGEKMSAFTKVGDKYVENIMTCTSADSITGKANFEGDLKYNANDRNVYLWVGNHEDFLGTNLIYLGDLDDQMSDLWENYKGISGRIFDSNVSYSIFGPQCLYQFGKSTISDDSSALNIKLNMVTSFLTIKVDSTILDKVMNGENYYFNVSSNSNDSTSKGFIVKPYFNFETGLLETDDGYSKYYYNIRGGSKYDNDWSLAFTKGSIIQVIKQYAGLISFPILPGNYEKFQISLTTRAMRKNYHWETKPWSFTTVIGDPDKVDDPSKNIYSSNRNFYFGTVNLQEVKEAE